MPPPLAVVTGAPQRTTRAKYEYPLAHFPADTSNKWYQAILEPFSARIDPYVINRARLSDLTMRVRAEPSEGVPPESQQVRDTASDRDQVRGLL